MKNLKEKIDNLLFIYNTGDYIKAESICRELIYENPKIVVLYNFLGIILSDQNRYNEAIDYYKKALEIDPNHAMVYSNLGNVYKSQNNLDEAEKSYKKSIELDNKISEPFNNLGNLLRSLNRYEEAIENYKKAISINNNFFWAHYNLGTTYTTLGLYDDAKETLEKVIKINPNFCTAHRSLSRLVKYNKKSKHLFEMQNIYKNKNIKDYQRKELAFALGKAYEDARDFVSSYEFYKKGNEIHRKNINFSITDEEKKFKEIKKIYNEELFEKFSKAGCSDSRTIFIVGMPRSGTTLVEQIISNHPDVFGCDELNYIPQLQKENKQIFTLNNIQMEALGKKYIDKVKIISKDSKIITDKLPINFKWIGFIKLILPNSKIVHCYRNSKDNCFSIYKNFFPNLINFAYDMNEITKFYNLYFDLIKHWKKILPNFIIDVEYEEIIKNPNAEIKKLIKSCNLEWQDDCLDFYKNRKPIKTASDTQARNKIYKSSVNSWKNYEKNMKIFFKDLLN